MHYPRSLVYMLQASEYNIRDYLKWYRQTDNFRHVERRGKLVKNQKTILLLAAAWTILFIFYATAFLELFVYSAQVGYLFFAVILLSAPYLLAYAIAAALLLGKIFIQAPIEYFIIRKAKKKLASHKALRIAIAGSFGKTSMREILKAVLSAGKRTAAPPRNHNTPLGISQFINGLKGDEEVLVFELGEYYPDDVRKLCELTQPQLGIITGVNEAHLERFKKLDETAKAIFELADWLGKSTLYVNGENKLAKENASANHILYDRNGAGEWKVKSFNSDLSGTSVVLENAKNEAELKVNSKLLGLHQIGPLVAAVDMASHLGIPLDKIKKGVEDTKPFEHRLEPRTDASGVITLDDSYNGNPDGVRAVIEFLASLKNHRRFYFTPGLVEMGTRTEAIHREIGRTLANAGIEKVILIKNSATPYIEQGLKESGYGGEVMWFNDAPAAFSALPHLTVKGDVVLIQNDWPDQYQ